MSRTCPYGCGKTYDGVHNQCVGQTKLLDMDKRIDIKRGKFGGHPAEPFDTTGKAKCVVCLGWYGNHRICEKATLPDCHQIVNGKMGTGTSNSSIFQQPIVYWIDEFRVRVKGEEQSFQNYFELVKFFLSLTSQMVLSATSDWWSGVLEELANQNIDRQFTKGMRLDVKDTFRCRNGQHYSLTALEDFEKLDSKVFKITGIRLSFPNIWSIPMLSEAYWKKTRPEKIQCLQGNEYNFASSAYYCARQDCKVGEWQAENYDEIHDTQYTYQELRNEPEVDCKYQVDANSMYPSVMLGTEQLPTYFPLGDSRWSDEDGGKEFAGGAVGMYKVEYTRPAGLKIAVLPAHKPAVVWDMSEGVGTGVYTEVDIKLALKYGYTFKFLGPCLVWDRVGHPFQEFVETMSTAKEVEQDRMVMKSLKLIMNSLYGKLSQRENKNADSIPISFAEAKELRRNGIHCPPIGDKFYKQKDVGQVVQNKHPNHLGSYVLSWTRVRMMQVFDCIDYDYDFCHTDGLRVSGANFHKLEAGGFIDPVALGKFKIEYGLIYWSHQYNVNKYDLKFLKDDDTVDEVVKGKQ